MMRNETTTVLDRLIALSKQQAKAKKEDANRKFAEAQAVFEASRTEEYMTVHFMAGYHTMSPTPLLDSILRMVIFSGKQFLISMTNGLWMSLWIKLTTAKQAFTHCSILFSPIDQIVTQLFQVLSPDAHLERRVHIYVGFTLRTYTHTTSAMQKAAADKVGSFIARAV